MSAHLREAWASLVTAADIVRLFHGTTEAALPMIRALGFQPSNPEMVAHDIEERYGLPRDSVLNHRWNEFTRGRIGDQNVYFTMEAESARHYAEAGSEVVEDCLKSAWRLLHDDMFDSEGDWKGDDPMGWSKAQRQWVAEETRKHYRPVLITCDVPFAELERAIMRTSIPKRTMPLEPWMFDKPWPGLSLEAPLPATWITAVQKL